MWDGLAAQIDQMNIESTDFKPDPINSYVHSIGMFCPVATEDYYYGRFLEISRHLYSEGPLGLEDHNLWDSRTKVL